MPASRRAREVDELWKSFDAQVFRYLPVAIFITRVAVLHAGIKYTTLSGNNPALVLTSESERSFYCPPE